MENIREILQREGISLETLTFDLCKRIQKLRKIKYSEEFAIYDDQWITLKEELPFDNINDVTLKKVIENLLVAKHMIHRTTNETLYELLENNPSYRFYPKSFYYSKA